MGHTPGPWIWDEPGNWCGLMARVCTEKHEPIAHVQVSGWKKKQAIATARLIAASPDLLAACKAALIEIEAAWQAEGVCFGPDRDIDKKIKAAVARAEGTK